MPDFAICVSDSYFVAADYSIGATKTIRFLPNATMREPRLTGRIKFVVVSDDPIRKKNVRLTTENIDGDLDFSVTSVLNNNEFEIWPKNDNTRLRSDALLRIQYDLPVHFDQTHEGSSIPFGFVPQFRCDSYNVSFRVALAGLLPGHFLIRDLSKHGFNTVGTIIEPFGDDLARSASLPGSLDAGCQIFVEYFHSMRHDPKLRTIQAIENAEGVSTQTFSQYVFLFILHVLPDLPPFIASFVDGGVSPEDIFLVPIPYSANKTQHSKIQSMGVSVADIATYGEQFETMVESFLHSALERSSDTGKRVIVVEDGGYVSKRLLAGVSNSALERIVGVVEQTTNGIYDVREHIEQGHELQFSMINVAETKLKQEIEAPHIGRAVVDNLVNLTKTVRQSPVLELRGKRVTVVGCGAIGRATIRELVGRGSIISAVEIDPSRHDLVTQEFGETDSVSVVSIDEAKNGTEYLSSADILIGCSGRTHIDTPGKIATLKDKAILVNASSKRREFDWDVIGDEFISQRVNPGFGMILTFKNGESHTKEVFFAAHGFPINFFSGLSVPVEVIEPVMAMLFRGALGLAQEDPEVSSKGLRILPANWESQIKKLSEDPDG